MDYFAGFHEALCTQHDSGRAVLSAGPLGLSSADSLGSLTSVPYLSFKVIPLWHVVFLLWISGAFYNLNCHGVYWLFSYVAYIINYF